MRSISNAAGYRWLIILAVFGFCYSSGAMAARNQDPEDCLLNKQAPPFILPVLGEETYVESDTLFEGAALTLLAFWTTHCTECSHRMEACQELFDWGLEDGLNVVGVNFDENTSSKMKSVAHRAAPRVQHLYDVGGRITAEYKAGSYSFSVFLVDESGRIRSVHHDVMPNRFRSMKPELTLLMNEAFGDFDDKNPNDSDDTDNLAPVTRSERSAALLAEFSSKTQNKIELHARGRLRWMNIDTTGVGAVGANNEPLTPGNSLRHRIDLELSYHISPALAAGALIRLSNEGGQVLRSGPDYLSNERGSIFINHKTRWQLPLLGRVQSNLIGGYYQIALTPLTLMRWDQSDTPVSGGSAGAAGFIRSESLEQLGADLGFEGARWNLTINDRIDFLALYARPQTPSPDDPLLCCELEPAESFYHQDLYATRLGGNIGLPWTIEPFELAATAVLVVEDENQPTCVTGCMDHDPYNNRVISFDALLPLPGRLSIASELALSDWTTHKKADPDFSLTASAVQIVLAKEIRIPTDLFLAGMMLDNLTGHLEVAYQRIESDFFSPYGALSLESNRQGLRASARFDWGPLGLGIFYKQLEKITPRSAQEYGYPRLGDTSGDTHTTWSVWADAALWAGGVAMIGTVRESKTLYETAGTNNEMGPQERSSLILNLEQELAPNCSIMAEAELLDGEWQEYLGSSPPAGAIREYESRIVRVMMEIEF